jgi:hypothetical protein
MGVQSMSLAAKLTALLEGFTSYQIKALNPADRQHLSNACERVLRDCIHQDAVAATNSGVLASLKRGDRAP